jgi:hypothetical protein
MPDVLEPIVHLMDCLTNKRRAHELRRVRQRLTQALDGVAPDARLRRLAQDLLDLREQLSRALTGAKACAHCVRPKSNAWPGGHCCSGSTDAVFTRDELVALKLAGTKVTDLSAPREEPSGCVFRGRQGCTLKVAHRPCLCVRYTCLELEAEITARGDRATVADLQRQLRLAFESFSRALEAQTRPEDGLVELRRRAGVTSLR